MRELSDMGFTQWEIDRLKEIASIQKNSDDPEMTKFCNKVFNNINNQDTK